MFQSLPHHENTIGPKPTSALDSMLTAESVSLQKFTPQDGFDLGVIAATLIRERDLSMAVEVTIATQVVFMANLSVTGTELTPWLKAKANVSQRHGISSLLAKRRRQEEGLPVEDFIPASGELLAYYGGSVPLRVRGLVIGTITTSGEAEEVDHLVSLEALNEFIAVQQTRKKDNQ